MGDRGGTRGSRAELIERAPDGDERSRGAILHHQGIDEENAGTEGGEADREYSSELDEDPYGEDLDDEELDGDYDYE